MCAKGPSPDNGRYPLSRAPGEPWLDPSEGWRVPWRLAADVQRFCDWTTGRTGSHAQAPTDRALLQPDYEPRALQSPGAGLRPTGHCSSGHSGRERTTGGSLEVVEGRGRVGMLRPQRVFAYGKGITQ